VSDVATRSYLAMGTTVTVATAEPSALDRALAVVVDHVAALDKAASRFRTDSEITTLNGAGGRPVQVSSVLFTALEEALDAAAQTDGLLTPTVGEALARVGYDQDFQSVPASGPPLTFHFQSVPGWRAIRLDRRLQRVTLPAGVRIDLGATAKAGCADRASRAAASEIGSGVLVNLGGDIAVAGPTRPEGWSIRIADRHDAAVDEPGVTVAIRDGGLATSGTAARRWLRGDQLMHHVIDPATGLPARTCWRTVTVAGATCLAANIASTAALILGPAAPTWLAERGHHARLVAGDGAVVHVGSWPSEARKPARIDVTTRQALPC
jgi:thiamine biosynthesis lipoprotein ApbE